MSSVSIEKTLGYIRIGVVSSIAIHSYFVATLKLHYKTNTARNFVSTKRVFVDGR